ncbi:hypothetical protein [Niallia sp. FSL W8-0635]|uniref:hypothetical protein n=1 Tax=Niallia sp. FSL W8-0635 TaxID=2975337 RepID=UPI0030F8825D
MLKKLKERFVKREEEIQVVEKDFEEYEYLNGDTIEYRREEETIPNPNSYYI